MKKNTVIVGATGMIGANVLRRCLENPEMSSVTSIGRRQSGISHDKLSEVLHADFSECSSLSEALKDCDLALFCIGAYTGSVSDDEFRKITVDYTVEFARVLYSTSPGATFCLLSGAGADSTEKSRVSFARYKGMAENALLEIGFPRVHIFRPGYIYPVTPRKEPNLMYRISRGVYPLLRHLMPGSVITSEELAQAMVIVGLDANFKVENPVLENRDIKKVVHT